jgi:hypothetical protein
VRRWIKDTSENAVKNPLDSSWATPAADQWKVVVVNFFLDGGRTV